MITNRKSADRGHTRLGWLESRHSFSFGSYFDPAQMGFGALRVLNEDRVAPGAGFGAHPHRDMEILTWVLEGELEHRDSEGSLTILAAGDVQRMSAGTGIVHSEVNASLDRELRFLQIWLLPERRGLAPSHDERRLGGETAAGAWQPVATRDGRHGSLRVHQDVTVSRTALGPGERLDTVLRPGRRAWLQVVDGRVEIAGATFDAGDGAAIEGETHLEIRSSEGADLLLFDLG